MARLPQIVVLGTLALLVGCSHTRIVTASNARDQGEELRTKYRYRFLWDDDWKKSNSDAWSCAAMCNVYLYESYQPGVFGADGIPITLAFDGDVKAFYSCLGVGVENPWNAFLSLCTVGIVPVFTDAHSHHKCQVSIAGTHIASVEICFKRNRAGSLLPLALLFYNGEGDTCFSVGHKFTLHGGESDLPREALGKAMAYGIASRLKEAEDSGRINDRLAAFARSSQSLSEAAATRSRAVSEGFARHGITLSGGNSRVEQPFEIVKCDNESGKDFAYSFALRKRGGAATTIADLGDMRSAFRSAIRAHYANLHPDANPRALVVDFTEYALRDGVVVGRVAVLTISPMSLSYDSASRRGGVKVRIGEGQFEDARRWIRRNLVSFVNKSNASVGGNVIPKGSRFYLEGEEMKDGVLDVAFKTE